jgi:hypothetical protein
VKEGHCNLEDALGKIMSLEAKCEDKTAELEQIRIRLTNVAELFEKKEIKQKYSFEVLCDFVHDKAKRLYTKYDSLVHNNKESSEEKKFFFERRIQDLENENLEIKESTAEAEKVV